LKRRAFLAAASLFPLMAVPAAQAANKKAATKKPAKKATGKAAKKNAARNAAPQTTARKSVLDAAHPGSSATRLPPVKAPVLPKTWQSFEVRTTVTLSPSRGKQRLWLPLPLNQDTLYQRVLRYSWQGNFGQGELSRLPDGDLEAFYGEWSEDVTPQLDLSVTVATADRHFDVSRRTLPPEREDILRRYLQASRQLPNEGKIDTLAKSVMGRVLDPVAQARALFNWVVDHAEYDARLPGCGVGEVREQLEALPEQIPANWRFKGRSADINGLFVALCRAIGLPARRVFGLRLAPSRLVGSLGIEEDASYAAHCRAEFYVPGYHWIPVDASDVCRAAKLEGWASEDQKLIQSRKILFGVWEMNWMAYNTGEDLTLPSDGPRLPFFGFPYLERLEGNLEGENARDFSYRIESRRV
jgi:transglutaminase-like putative cysteine protease